MFRVCLFNKGIIWFWKVTSIFINIKTIFFQVLSEVTGTPHPFHHLWWRLWNMLRVSLLLSMSLWRGARHFCYYHLLPCNTMTCKSLMSAPCGQGLVLTSQCFISCVSPDCTQTLITQDNIVSNKRMPNNVSSKVWFKVAESTWKNPIKLTCRLMVACGVWCNTSAY